MTLSSMTPYPTRSFSQAEMIHVWLYLQSHSATIGIQMKKDFAFSLSS